MGAIPSLSDEGWASVRKASELGVDDVTLSQEYGVSRVAIRQRRLRQGWITAEKLESQALAMRSKKGETTVTSHIVTEPPKALEIVAKSLAERGEAYGLRVFDYASSAVQKAMDQGLLPTPDNWKTVAIADQMARRAAGLDKTTTAVQVNLGNFFRPSQENGSGCVVLDDGPSLDSDSESGAGDERSPIPAFNCPSLNKRQVITR